MSNVKTAIQSQYLAGLAMLEEAITRCPDNLWDAAQPVNRFWQVAFHSLFYVHLYLQPTEANFTRWEKHERDVPLGHDPEADSTVQPFTQSELLEYLALCREQVQIQVDAMDLAAPSGFYWLPFDKMELQFYNIRHLTLHTGELCERLSVRAGVEVGWVGKGLTPPVL